jgi:integrase/recombinase XerD
MPEYNPLNEPVKKQYEHSLLHGRGRDPKTVRAVWSDINLYENFTHNADFKTFDQEQAMTFKAWLEKQTNKNGELLSLSTVRSTMNNLREFFLWLTIHPKYIGKVDGRAVPYLRLSDNANRAARATRDKPPPALEQLETTLSAMPETTDIEKRNKAMFAFVIITCVRNDALITLKMKDVDAEKKTVWQDPKHVKTKRRKGIVTGFVRAIMPQAEDIVLDWVKHATEVLKLKPNDPIFPKTRIAPGPETGAFEAQGLSHEHWANTQPVREIFKDAFEMVNVPYFNPHLFRKTVCKWALKNCTQYEFKALSQNFGHDHSMTTYNAYANLTEDQQLDAIANMGKADANLQSASMDDLLAEVARRTPNNQR